MIYKDLEKMVNDYFGDTSRAASETREDFENLVEHIESMIEAIKSDERKA